MRWQWLKRPRWAIPVALILALVVWAIWPVKVYRERYYPSPGFGRSTGLPLPVSDDEIPESLHPFVPYAVCHFSAAEAVGALSEIKETGSFVEAGPSIGDESYWIWNEVRGGVRHFNYRRGNIVVGFGRHYGYDDRSTEFADVEKEFAVSVFEELDQAIVRGEIEEFRAAWYCNGWLWLQSRYGHFWQ